MAIRAYYRTELALSQLDTALALYFEGRDYASVVTLAGAADEIFGQLLAADGRENSLESTKKAVAAIHRHLYGEALAASIVVERANRARNCLKHWNVGDSHIVKLDLPEEARDMLNRAIDNYWSLESKLSLSMERFQREIMAV